MPFSLAAALVSGTRPGSEHNIFATFCGGPISPGLIHTISPAGSEAGSRPKVQLALPPHEAFQLLRDAAGGESDLVAHDPARVDASASFAQLVGGHHSSGASWLVSRRQLSVHGGLVIGHLLYGAVASDGAAVGCELEVSAAAPEEDASRAGLVLHDDGTAQLTPAPVAASPPVLGAWVRKRAEEQPGVEFTGEGGVGGGDAVFTPVLPEALQLGIPPGKRASVAWDAQRHPELGAWLEGLEPQDQAPWLLSIQQSVAAANTASCEVCFALQAAHVALAALPGDGTPLFEAPCLAQAGLDSLHDARAGMLRCAVCHHLVSPDTSPEGWDCGVAPPQAWAAVGTALRVRLPRGDRLGLMHSLEREACDGAGLLALVAALSWLPTAAAPGGPPPSSFVECLGASCRAIVRLPISCRIMLRSQLVAAWRVALHMRSDAQLLAFLQRRAVELQQRRAKVASGSPPRPGDAVPRGKATFRGTVHSAWSEGGSNGPPGGEALVFDFRIVTALDVGDDAQSSLFGVRFDPTCMAAGHSFDGVMEGDTVEAEAVTIDAKTVRASGVRVVRRGQGSRPQDMRRRVQAGRDELVAGSVAASAASAPTLPGWVQASEFNHDGQPLWAGPCSACGVLCTVPFRPRQPVGCAISSPPLCRQCRTAQLAVQAQQAAQAQGGYTALFGPVRHGTPPPGLGMTSPRTSMNGAAVRGASPPLPPMAGHMSALGPFGMGAEGSHHGGVSAASLPRRIGIVKFYKPESGFGFIQPLTADGSPSLEPDIFVHCTQAPAPVHPDAPPLVHGQVVEYNEVFSFGRRQAVGLSLPMGGAHDPRTPLRTDIRRASFDDAALLERQSGLQLPPFLFPDSLDEDAGGSCKSPSTPLYTFTDQARHVTTNDSSGGTSNTMSPDDDDAQTHPTSVRPTLMPTTYNFFSNGSLW